MNNHTDNHSNKHGKPHTVVDFPDTETLEDQAASWVSKLDADQPSKATVTAFKQWVNQSAEHRSIFEKQLALWNDMNVLTGLVAPVQAQAQQAQRVSRWPAFNFGLDIRRFGLSGQGFAVCALLTVFFVFQFNSQSPERYITAIGEQKTVQLVDGTSVLLNTNTVLEVDYSDQRRAVYLRQGQAHFAVAHNPEVPFEVFAGSGKVRAIGTAFTVYLKSDDVEVVVTEGVVAILSAQQQSNTPLAESAAATKSSSAAKQGDAAVAAAEGSSAALTDAQADAPVKVSAGNVVTYDRHTAKHIIQEVLDKGIDKLSWHDGVLIFRSESLERVIKEVNRYTTIKIVIPSQEVRSIKVGGFFDMADINSVFDALEQGFDIHANVISDKLVYLERIKK